MGKKKKNYDFADGGFKFRVKESDYDYCRAKSLRYKYNPQNWERAMRLTDHNHDFDYREYDCTGSTRVEYYAKRKGRYMYVYYNWDKDV